MFLIAKMINSKYLCLVLEVNFLSDSEMQNTFSECYPQNSYLVFDGKFVSIYDYSHKEKPGE